MKPSKNALFGYSYQKITAFFLLIKMDVEREIERIEIEADVSNNFDDVKIIVKHEEMYCQMKDINDVSLEDLKIEQENINIKGKNHKLSKRINILFLKDIKITNNSQMLGIPAYKKSNIFIVSISRDAIINKIDEIYKRNEKRLPIINRFFENCFDRRQLIIDREDLPVVDIYNTQLLEQTINTGKCHLKIENILIMEGKPGVGKSHLVNCLTDEYKNNIVYRFWISNQDKNYKERLIYYNFISNISKEIFNDFVFRSEEDIIQKLSDEERIVIIDGFDHIENYNKEELQHYIDFIDKLKNKCKTIVLTRPLKIKLDWKKQILENWTKDQTLKVLDELFHIIDHRVCDRIFSLTMGYPILVRYIAEHYKTFNILPQMKELKGLEDYYSKIVKNVDTKSALALFISSRSFFMKSEISEFLDDELADIVNEFISSYPYLFEIKLNRITLFHDSFNTYLRNQGINNSKRITKINQKVFQSIMNGEKRYLSRFSYFNLDQNMKLNIIIKYTSMLVFENLIKDAIDFEAIRSFYFQIRESLHDLAPEDLEIINYYDLSLIINIVNRDHVSTINEFFYTFAKCLIFNGYSEENITSSEYLFAMFYYIKTDNISLLYNLTSNNNYSTDNYYEIFLNEIKSEDCYFDIHQKPIKLTQKIRGIFNTVLEYQSKDLIRYILENLYIHNTEIEEFIEFRESIVKYIDVDKKEGIIILEKLLPEYNIRPFYANMILMDAKSKIVSLGKDKGPNEYRILSLNDFIKKYRHIGSFKMWVEILNYIRLSLKEKRRIDLSSIALFWPMYHERKDYSVLNLDVALKAFEEKKYVTEDKSIQIIVFTQSMSEKGIRHLLKSYITLHSPDILLTILGKYDIENLEISFFDLPAKFIDSLPDEVIRYAMGKILKYHYYNKTIDFVEIENAFYSKAWEWIVHKLKILKYKIKIPTSHMLVEELKKYDVILELEPNKDDKSEYKMDSIESYNQGILGSEDINFIKENKLDMTEIAGYPNGYYSLFSDLNIYKIYEIEELKKNTKNILYNAISGKIKSINMYGNVYYFVGNIPKFLIDFDINYNFNKLYNSFMKFLGLSLLKNE